ncbi:hypothetical protein SEPCBS57363_005676 [Sporothrix epigloea]|uniref:Uncharacterized protein n=1 Tax=Sporothrix epigloea TaxID=1892477 RepID=A0ABP0DZ47_9PEZI
MHCMWDKAFFALKPLSSTDQDVTVQFHWLNRSVKAVKEELDGFESAMQTVCGGNTRDWGTPQLAHRPSGLRIETGQLFKIRAAKPYLLPSFKLLELQWNLLRMSAMSGAANIYDQDEEDDKDSADGSAQLVSESKENLMSKMKSQPETHFEVGDKEKEVWS